MLRYGEKVSYYLSYNCRRLRCLCAIVNLLNQVVVFMLSEGKSVGKCDKLLLELNI